MCSKLKLPAPECPRPEEESFTCPQCGGHYFGTSNPQRKGNDETSARLWREYSALSKDGSKETEAAWVRYYEHQQQLYGPNTRHCHDQYETGCHWSGPDSACWNAKAGDARLARHTRELEEKTRPYVPDPRD